MEKLLWCARTACNRAADNVLSAAAGFGAQGPGQCAFPVWMQAMKSDLPKPVSLTQYLTEERRAGYGDTDLIK
jgi:hypothetical protein